MTKFEACELIDGYICDLDWTSSFYRDTDYFDLAALIAVELANRIGASDDDPYNVAVDLRDELCFYAENNAHTRKMFEIYVQSVTDIIDCYLYEE